MSIPGLSFDLNASSRELESIEQSYNETLKRYGITTKNTVDSMACDSDTDGIRPTEIGAKAVHMAGSKSANRELATEER